MNRRKHALLLTHVQENNETYEYLGSDGLPIEDSYQIYLKRCSEFIAKAKKYKRDNIGIKEALLHQTKYCYENSEEFEEQVLIERREQMELYNKMFAITTFGDDPNCMYENTKGLSKRIRIIRELDEPQPLQRFSENFDTETKCWFTRYCALSRFIQAARMIIILNRLKKRLKVLRYLTRDDVQKYEIIQNEEPTVQEEEEKILDLPPAKFPCNYLQNNNTSPSYL